MSTRWPLAGVSSGRAAAATTALAERLHAEGTEGGSSGESIELGLQRQLAALTLDIPLPSSMLRSVRRVPAVVLLVRAGSAVAGRHRRRHVLLRTAHRDQRRARFAALQQRELALQVRPWRCHNIGKLKGNWQTAGTRRRLFACSSHHVIALATGRSSYLAASMYTV